ncbi:MAG TPA: hypothetical protein VHF69_06290 [Candidatus Synoicihabitans sp.]|nr:hypothetical protein [Candidatus Synoicihabitans sp.]
MSHALFLLPRRAIRTCYALALACAAQFVSAKSAQSADELVLLDDQGVIRWRGDGSEVALFGANYCLPSASDYRAAGYVGADRKQLVEKDLLHFARMGWDAMRICLWGDWENSDVHGNLIVNDHLDVMDYAIAEAKKRGVYILFTPITTYGAWWPDGDRDHPYAGFSKHFERPELGTNPAAIAAQQNYLRQILEHVNPYTGVALKDEPQILFIEMINEPVHHPEDFAGSVSYINELVDAVRSTGCDKILFHNLTQDTRMVDAINASQVQGVTFAWYPTGLNVGRTLTDNHLRSVDHFTPMLQPDLLRVPKIVYEFDSSDVNSGYMLPAMARAFRGVGAQFAAMFSYDMLDTAPYNLGWQTHFLNLVHSPKKAVSAVIAAEVMRRVPRYAHYGDYPANTRFGPFRVSYEEDQGEVMTDEMFMHANDTQSAPPAPEKLRRVVGVGCSPIIDYPGNGAYFLDRIAEGLWRLEIYPDALLVQDPFAQRLNYQSVSSRLVWRTWPMHVQLPDLGDGFLVKGLNEGNAFAGTARHGRFHVSPGVYLLARDATAAAASLPDRVGHVGIGEFVCPPAPELSAQILPAMPAAFIAGQPATVGADIVDEVAPRQATLQIRRAGEDREFRSFPIEPQRGYRYATTLPASLLQAGNLEYFFAIETAAGESVRHPEQADSVLIARVADTREPLTLFDATHDIPQLVYTRIGDNVRRGIFQAMPATDQDPAALRLMFPLSMDRTLDDYTASLAVHERVRARAAHTAGATAIRVRSRGAGDGQPFFITLVEADGTAWSTRLQLGAAWQHIDVPLSELRLARGVMLPLGYPQRWNYWTSPAQGRGAPEDRIRTDQIERVQMSFRPTRDQAAPKNDTSVDVASVTLVFE